MADGMDKSFELRLGIPPNEPCARCAGLPGYRACGFFYGRFTPDNWGCVTLNQLQQVALLEGHVTAVPGKVLGVVANPTVTHGYAVLIWDPETPQRVSSAVWFDTAGKPTPLVQRDAEDLLDG